MKLSLVLTLALALALSSVLFPGMLTAGGGGARFTAGTWGGEHVVLEVSKSGAASGIRFAPMARSRSR